MRKVINMSDLVRIDTQPRQGLISRFRVGDVVRNGAHVATVTDVGTVLIAVRTAMGTDRMVCPWELVPLRTAQQPPAVGALR